MAEEVVSPYLRSKFSSILQEAEADSSSPSHIILRFRSIERLIDFMFESRSTRRIPVDLLYDLIDALSECRILAHHRHQASLSKKGFFWFIKVSPLSEFLFKKNMKKRLDEMERKLKDINLEPGLHYSTTTPRQVEIQQTYPVLDPSRIIGFEAEVEKIENLLMDKQYLVEKGLTAIGIVGRCGCGKTALAQKLYASPKIQNEFSPLIWVCLSNMLFDNERVEDTRVRVLKYILEETGYDVGELEYGDFSLINLLQKLHRRLTGKRYLIVLDNVWRVDEWYADLAYTLPRGYETGEFFSHGLPKGSGGGVIVTSRRDNVIRRTVGDDHKYVIRLQPHLSNDICREIFADVVRQQGKIERSHPTLKKIEDEIIRNCDGLPLAAKILGNIIQICFDDTPSL